MNYEKLYKAINYSFKDEALLLEALTHRSANKKHYERLEFLGDSVLGFVVADSLFRRGLDINEGELSRMRSTLVCGDRLAKLALELGLAEFIELGAGELKSGGRERPALLCDIMESLIGAIYLDSDLITAKEKILIWFNDEIEEIIRHPAVKDPKTALQEWSQQHLKTVPNYDVVEVVGPVHEQIFKVSCQVEGVEDICYARDRSRKAAEQKAAAELLASLLDRLKNDRK